MNDVSRKQARDFGFVFAVVFSVVAFWPVIFGEAFTSVRIWALVIGCAFFFMAIVVPGWLKILCRWWLAFGVLLHKIVSPIVVGMMFFVMLTPIGLLMRLLGKRPLALSYDKSKKSYWVERQQQLDAESMKHQF